MLFNLSYNKKEVNDQLEAMVGKSIPFLRRLKLKGIGSQRLIIEEANSEILALLEKSVSTRFCNLDLRSKGLLVWFRVKLHNYALALPYHTITVVRGDNFVTLFSGQWKVKLAASNNSKLDHSFIDKIMQLKMEALPIQDQIKK